MWSPPDGVARQRSYRGGMSVARASVTGVMASSLAVATGGRGDIAARVRSGRIENSSWTDP
jgi:hypothetical protein